MSRSRSSPKASDAVQVAEAQAAWDTLREPIVSAVQGDPRAAMAYASIVSGGLLKLASLTMGAMKDAVRSTKDPAMADSKKEIGDLLQAGQSATDLTANALWGIAGVDTTGRSVESVIKAWKGVPEVPRTYDVTHNPKTLSTSESSSSTTYGSGGLLNDISGPAGSSPVARAIPWALGAAAVAAAIGITVAEAQALLDARARAAAEASGSQTEYVPGQPPSGHEHTPAQEPPAAVSPSPRRGLSPANRRQNEGPGLPSDFSSVPHPVVRGLSEEGWRNVGLTAIGVGVAAAVNVGIQYVQNSVGVVSAEAPSVIEQWATYIVETFG